MCAKMFATCLHMMQGTPYVYQGEEIGMTNFPFTEIDQVDDVESVHIYDTYVKENKEYTHEQMMKIISKKGRDNARTPMQWDDSENGGFSTGTPWLAVNPNYTVINAKSQVNDPNSIFSYYKKLIRLRKEHEIIVYGTYDLLYPEDEKLYVFTRTLGEEKLLVICNFSEETVELPEDLKAMIVEQKGILIRNYSEESEKIRPYEAIVYQL